MVNYLEKISNKDFLLRSIKVNRILEEESVEDIEYSINAKYKILENKNGDITLRVLVSAGFIPDMMFKAELEFNVYINMEIDIADKEIDKNIEELLYFLGSEVSYLLATITKSMGGSALILPPTIKGIEKM